MTKELTDLCEKIATLPDDANILVQHAPPLDKRFKGTRNPVTFKLNAAALKSLVTELETLRAALAGLVEAVEQMPVDARDMPANYALFQAWGRAKTVLNGGGND